MSDERTASLARMKALWEEYSERHGAKIPGMLDRLKARISGNSGQRKKLVAYAVMMVPHVAKGRAELRAEMGKTDGDYNLAKWLNENGHKPVHHRVSKRSPMSGEIENGIDREPSKFEGSNIGRTLFAIDQKIATEAVMECRARMSSMALSANFEIHSADRDRLESECIDQIIEGIKLRRALSPERDKEGLIIEPSEQRYFEDAKAMAIAEALRQREDYVPLLARMCFLGSRDLTRFDQAVPGIERLSD